MSVLKAGIAATAITLNAIALPASAGAEEAPGYRYASTDLPRSPVTLSDLDLLKKTLLFTEDDVTHLRLAGEVLSDQIEAVLDVWYGFVGANPHLIYYFTNKADGSPNTEYLARVRQRFALWIRDITAANYDQVWLDYQHEIGRRHHRIGKNEVDAAPSVDHIHFRYLVAFIYPISATVKPFLANKGHAPETVEKMYAAWTKAVILQTILWSHPYIREGDF
ncbi:protoglobin domain-containing protein [Pelagibius sp.]|uniref:protoglobin domain-containing protein n=1 Tax=Pelagibius sp. TaxID=1931238 RepID=UPI003BB1A98A